MIEAKDVKKSFGKFSVLTGVSFVVEPGTVVTAGWIWAGRPARAFRAVKASEREMFAQAAKIYVGYGAAYRRGQSHRDGCRPDRAGDQSAGDRDPAEPEPRDRMECLWQCAEG